MDDEKSDGERETERHRESEIDREMQRERETDREGGEGECLSIFYLTACLSVYLT